MDNLNNLYIFKNPIRHFFNVDSLLFENTAELEIKNLCWTSPVKFKIFKNNESTRTINFPNLLNYYCAITKFQTEENFLTIKKMSPRKRVSPDLRTGEFSVLSYDEAIQKDLFNLTKYDTLLLLDIKSFYGRIYTHDFGFTADKDNELERRVTSLNNGKTNGILPGTYLSLYLAEKVLAQIEKELDGKLKNLTCHYEYFSDDFYFFCNKNDIELIKKIFIEVLDCHELELNEEKTQLLDFEEYSNNNNLEKLWKKIILLSSKKDANQNKNISNAKYPAFFTQLVYRLNKISELKYKRIFLVNFFKTKYFRQFECEKYTLSPSDFNYLCYIYKLTPESILYSLDKILKMEGFNKKLFKDFIKTRFESSLKTERYEEQVYYYYAIMLCGYEDLLPEFKELVLNSKNQILISYLIMDKTIKKKDYRIIFNNSKEYEWLQNYHYIMTYNNLCNKINKLIPIYAKKTNQEDSYKSFYKNNLDKRIPIIRPIKEVINAIHVYLDNKIESYNKDANTNSKT